MEYFPSLPSITETESFINRMQKMYREKNYCYFAVELLSTNKFIGFIGLSDQIFESPYTPYVDIGWRLDKDIWGKGYATEGALKCLDYGFNHIYLNSIRAFAPIANQKSIAVMKRIGMSPLGEFHHPALMNYPELVECVCYELVN